MPAAPFVDLYEILQVSPKAEKDTIKRVYQILSLKYQLASNGNVGNADFSLLQQAAATLLDSANRAKYDQERAIRLAGVAEAAEAAVVPPVVVEAPMPAPPPEVVPAAVVADETKAKSKLDPHRFMDGLDIDGEKRRRAGLVEICYRQRLLKPRQPTLSVKQLEDGMELTVSELEGSMWYLKETELLRVSDAGNFAITTKGMDAIEGGFINFVDGRFDMTNFRG